ncbi:DUF7489 domain-containing protein [Phycicoccus sonneratiae]|uniref:DUF7489 domain-containing protein n=1 Tax=Phycicoccus sonneratiae TaxID=2807628 RepID=A0ABS2CG18_9MICO|nr:hypothetical protein [Phycicoccus sonneraticus]MBM6398809.1 hypothetical protein [Phycicoccus sonneraticus]
MTDDDTWSGTVVRRSRGLLDGSNLYRRVTVRLEDGSTRRVRVARDLWAGLEVGDRVEQLAGGGLRRG